MSTRVDPRPVRVPVRVLSTSNLTLSGLQTVTGVALVEWDLVACVGQSDNKNAIYVVQDGSWIVADPNVGTGLEVYATAGSNAGKLYGCDTTGAIAWGTTTTSFTLKGSSGAVFDPAAPGPLGATTPSTARFTTLTIVGGTSTSPEANVVNRFAAGDGLTETRRFSSAGGIYSERSLSQAAAGQSRFSVGTVSLADDAVLDISISGGGHGTVTAVGPVSTVSGSFSFAASGATTTNGLTYTNFDTGDTDTKLCAFTGGANTLRIKNRLGATREILITLWEGVTAG